MQLGKASMNLQTLSIKIRRLLSRALNPHQINYHNTQQNDKDITSYRSTKDIFKSGQFTPAERRKEYRRRGKSPSGVIDGVYNDMNLENGASYNDMDRDWDADA